MHRNHLANYLPKLATEWHGIMYHRTSLISRNDQRAYSRSGCPLETLRQRNVIYVYSREGWMTARGYEKRRYNYYRRQVAVAIVATMAVAAAAAAASTAATTTAYGECEESTSSNFPSSPSIPSRRITICTSRQIP